MEKIYFSNFFLLLIFLSLILESKSSENFRSTDFAIQKNFIDGLIKHDGVINSDGILILCCNISNFQGNKIVFTLISERSLDIYCDQSSSNETDSYNDDNSIKINSTIFHIPNKRIVIADLINIKENPFLYISLSNIGNKENKITFLMTETENYKTEYKTEEILNPAAYVAYKLDYKEMFNKVKEEEFLLSTTKGKIIIYCYLQKDNFFEFSYQDYKFFPFNQQSIAFLYNDYDPYHERNFMIFIGVDEYIENDKMTIFCTYPEKEKLYFYNYQLNSYDFFNFF